MCNDAAMLVVAIAACIYISDRLIVAMISFIHFYNDKLDQEDEEKNQNEVNEEAETSFVKVPRLSGSMENWIYDINEEVWRYKI